MRSGKAERGEAATGLLLIAVHQCGAAMDLRGSASVRSGHGSTWIGRGAFVSKGRIQAEKPPPVAMTAGRLSVYDTWPRN